MLTPQLPRTGYLIGGGGGASAGSTPGSAFGRTPGSVPVRRLSEAMHTPGSSGRLPHHLLDPDSGVKQDGTPAAPPSTSMPSTLKQRLLGGHQAHHHNNNNNVASPSVFSDGPKKDASPQVGSDAVGTSGGRPPLPSATPGFRRPGSKLSRFASTDVPAVALGGGGSSLPRSASGHLSGHSSHSSELDLEEAAAALTGLADGPASASTAAITTQQQQGAGRGGAIKLTQSCVVSPSGLARTSAVPSPLVHMQGLRIGRHRQPFGRLDEEPAPEAGEGGGDNAAPAQQLLRLPAAGAARRPRGSSGFARPVTPPRRHSRLHVASGAAAVGPQQQQQHQASGNPLWMDLLRNAHVTLQQHSAHTQAHRAALVSSPAASLPAAPATPCVLMAGGAAHRREQPPTPVVAAAPGTSSQAQDADTARPPTPFSRRHASAAAAPSAADVVSRGMQQPVLEILPLRVAPKGPVDEGWMQALSPQVRALCDSLVNGQIVLRQLLSCHAQLATTAGRPAPAPQLSPAAALMPPAPHAAACQAQTAAAPTAAPAMQAALAAQLAAAATVSATVAAPLTDVAAECEEDGKENQPPTEDSNAAGTWKKVMQQ